MYVNMQRQCHQKYIAVVVIGCCIIIATIIFLTGLTTISSIFILEGNNINGGGSRIITQDSTILGDRHTVLLREKYQERFVLFTNDDNNNNNNNNNNTSISIIDNNNNSCELPHCSTILRSRLYSERCDHTSPLFRPLLITGTPRSATTYTSQKLRSLGMRIQNDWLFPHLPHGRVSWIYAFEDPKPFGRVKDLSHNEKYLHVLHQVKEPLASITSMCTEPIGKDKYWKFLGRHIRFTSSFEYPRRISRMVLEFYLEWHSFLNELKLPTYRVEDVNFKDIFNISGLGNRYVNRRYERKVKKSSPVSKSYNSRSHRPTFTWQEIYTINPQHAARLWEMAIKFGYTYPDVNFDELTCLEYLPMCDDGGTSQEVIPSDKCPPGTHPYPTDMSGIVARRPTSANGYNGDGWVSSGCREQKALDGSFYGVDDYLLPF